jgi:hypothetical protein
MRKILMICCVVTVGGLFDCNAMKTSIDPSRETADRSQICALAQKDAMAIWGKYSPDLYSEKNFPNFVNILNGGICNRPWSTLEGVNAFKHTLVGKALEKLRVDYQSSGNAEQKRGIAEKAYVVLFPFRNNKDFSSQREEVNGWLLETPKDVPSDRVSYQGMFDKRIIDHMWRIYHQLLLINKQMGASLLDVLRSKRVIKHEIR